MKRLHVHLHVTDLDSSVRFYNDLFAADPAVLKDDYAKWMLEEPRVNFAVSTGAPGGLDHLGIQVETPDELREPSAHTTCCYARSEKSWVTDPQGIRWEMFLTSGTSDDRACCPG